VAAKRKKHRPRYKPKDEPKGRTSQQTIHRSEPPLIVFISSVIDKMMSERDAVDRAIRSIPISGTWRFECTPASSQPLEESYLSKVRDCDIFVILLGPEYSKPVAREYQTAVESGKPVLAFVQKGTSPEQNELVGLLDTKYAPYIDSEDLQRVVLASVLDEMIRRFKSTLRQADLPKLIENLPPVRKPEEVSGYAVVGMQEETMAKAFELFDVLPPPANLEELYPSYKQVYFDNFSEMKEAFTALANAATKARQAPADRQKTYLRALQEESLEIASRYVLRKRTGRTAPKVEIAGIKYFVCAVAPDIARLIKLMRPAEITEGPTPAQRTAYEYLFKNVEYLQAVFAAIYKASQDAGDDIDEFLRLLSSPLCA
jgi:uncharacterized protein DUF4062